MDKLKHYKLDRAFTDGVEIRLDNATDVAFLVRLPSQYNRAYQQAVYEGIDISTDDNSKSAERLARISGFRIEIAYPGLSGTERPAGADKA